MNKILLATIALITIGSHYAEISSTIPVILLTLILIAVFGFSKKLITSNDSKQKMILLGLTTIYIVSGIVFLLNGEGTKLILETGALIILFASIIIGAVWLFTDKPETSQNLKYLASQAYLIGCLDIGFALLHHWHS